MAPHATIRGAAGANAALGLILMLLTPILSASPLAVPTVARSTADAPQQQHQQQQSSSAAIWRIDSSQQQPQILSKIINWAEKPPDPHPLAASIASAPVSSPRVVGVASSSAVIPATVQHVLQRTRQVKDLYYLIPSANLYKSAGAAAEEISQPQQPPHHQQHAAPPTFTNDDGRYQRGAFNTSTDAKSVYFGKSFINHSTHTVAEHNTTQQVLYSNHLNQLINVSSASSSSSSSSVSSSVSSPDHRIGVATYFSDASLLEANRYRELLQQKLYHKQTQLQRLQVSPQLVTPITTADNGNNKSNAASASSHNNNNLKIINSDGADKSVKSNINQSRSSLDSVPPESTTQISSSVKLVGKSCVFVLSLPPFSQ